MTRHGATAALILVTLLGACVRAAEACTCILSRFGTPPCQARWQAAAVFSGKVISIDNVTSRGYSVGMPWTRQERRVRLSVIESFGTVPDDEVEVWTAASDGECGYAFEVGRSYLVYADKRDRRLETSICSHTNNLERASEDLVYLRSIRSVIPRDGRIIGAITTVAPGPGDKKTTPLPGILVIAEGQGLRRTATTDSAGRYEIRVPAGRYRLWPELPPAMKSDGPLDVELKDVRGCVASGFVIVK